MAVEFGAKLYLKDNMYATLKKNLGLQREFSEQVDKTNASMQQMGRTRVNATINATDNASGVVESVRQTVNSVGNTTVSPEVSLQDNASGVIGAIQDTLDMGSCLRNGFISIRKHFYFFMCRYSKYRDCNRDLLLICIQWSVCLLNAME